MAALSSPHGLNTMVRHGRSSVTDSVPLTYFVPEMTALSIVSKHLKFLTKKKKLTRKLIEMKNNKNLDMAERELLRSRHCVRNQIKVLKRLKRKFTPKSTKNRALSFVAKLLQNLDQKQALISEIEEYLCLGKSLSIPQEKALACKSGIVHQMDVLERIFKEISLAQLPLTHPELGREVVEYQLPPLLLHLSELRGFVDILEHDVRESTGDCVRESVRRCRAIRNLNFSPSMNENETREVINRVESESPRHKERYLCLTNGFEIFCLDLKQSKYQTFNTAEDVPPLPKMATLKLLEEGLPVASVGLFKWRSNAYMICAKVLKSLVDEVHSSNPSHECRSSGKWSYLLENLYKGGSSCDIHRFSLAEDGTSSYSDFAKLNKPKSWPIVENIDGQIHLIDSLPLCLVGGFYGWTFSHEVLNPDNSTWTEISSPIEDVLHIESLLVVGDRIFAVSPMDLMFETHSAPSYLLFKSKTKKWEQCQRKRHHVYIEDVWDILELKHAARCAVGGLAYENPSEPLYVIIALEHGLTKFEDGLCAKAYLVTSKGKVVCVQILLDFFTGPVWPFQVFEAKLIKVEDDEGKATICSIVVATTWEQSTGKYVVPQYVFISTFSVEKLSYTESRVQQLLAKGKKAWPVVLDFVRVDIKDKCVYRRNGELEEGDDSDRWVGVQACFL